MGSDTGSRRTGNPAFATKLFSTLSANNAVKERKPLEMNNGHPGRTVHVDSRRDCMLDEPQPSHVTTPASGCPSQKDDKQALGGRGSELQPSPDSNCWSKREQGSFVSQVSIFPPITPHPYLLSWPAGLQFLKQPSPHSKTAFSPLHIVGLCAN